MSLFETNRGIAVQNQQPWRTMGKSEETKGRSAFMRFWEEIGKGSGGFILASVVGSLLLGQKEILFLPAESSSCSE